LAPLPPPKLNSQENNFCKQISFHLFSESNATHPVSCDSPLQKVMAVGALFQKSKLAGSGVICC
jgi:hypothetical protein